jgi:hypothetical protein
MALNTYILFKIVDLKDIYTLGLIFYDNPLLLEISKFYSPLM